MYINTEDTLIISVFADGCSNYAKEVEAGRRLFVRRGSTLSFGVVPIEDMQLLETLDSPEMAEALKHVMERGREQESCMLTTLEPIEGKTVIGTTKSSPVWLDLDNHYLIAGTSGPDRSALLSAAIAGALATDHETELVVVSANPTVYLSHTPVAQMPITVRVNMEDPERIQAFREQLAQELAFRQNALTRHEALTVDDYRRMHPRAPRICDIVLILDQADILLKDDPELAALLTRIIERGSMFGIYVWAIGAANIANFPVVELFTRRIALQIEDRRQAHKLLRSDAPAPNSLPPFSGLLQEPKQRALTQFTLVKSDVAPSPLHTREGSWLSKPIHASLGEVCSRAGESQFSTLHSIPFGIQATPVRRQWSPYLLDLSGNVLVEAGDLSTNDLACTTILSALALSNRPDQVQVFFIGNGWESPLLQGLPHVIHACHDNDADISRVFKEIEAIRASRESLLKTHGVHTLDEYRDTVKEADAKPIPEIFIFLDSFGLLQEFQSILATGPALGLHIVYSSDEYIPLSDQSSFATVIRPPKLNDHYGFVSVSNSDVDIRIAEPYLGMSEPNERFSDIVDQALAQANGQTAPKLPPIELWSDWATLTSTTDPGNLDLALRWSQISQWNDPQRLRVPIGFKPTGGIVQLDLKSNTEGGVGPHGMVIGPTGSGRTGFLKNMILNLMITHSPELVNFFIVDYKGESTFSDLEGTPHLAAHVGNLEEHESLIDRMRDSLLGELDRRERIFHQAQARYPKEDIKNHSDYMRLRAKNWRDFQLPVLPVLLVIVEEFTELLAARPELAKVFVRFNRQARSLGAHAIYSAPTVEGCAPAKDLEPNVSYKVVFKTTSPSESRSLLGSDAACRLPSTPGCAIVWGTSLGSLESIRSGYTESPYFPPGCEPPYVDTESDLDQTQTIWSVCIDQLRAATADKPYQPYIPPLATLTLSQTEKPHLWKPDNNFVAATMIPIGRLDDRFQHHQPDWLIDRTKSTLIIGGPRKGKSIAMDSLLASLALTTTPQQAQAFVINYGGMHEQLNELPHVVGWADPGQNDTIERILLEIKNIRRNRERLFREHKIFDIAEYRQQRTNPNSPLHQLDQYGDVYLFLDSWHNAASDGNVLANRAEELADPFRGGECFGLHLVISSTTHSQTRPIQALMANVIELSNDTGLSLISHTLAKGLDPQPGFAIATGSQLYGRIALPRIDQDASSASLPKGIEHLVNSVNETSQGRALRLRMLPATLTRDELKELAPPNPDATPQERLRLPFGIRESTGEPAYAEMNREPHLLILGEAKSGMSETIGTIITSIAERYPTKEDAVVLLYDPKSSSLERIPETNLYAVVTNDDDFKREIQKLIDEHSTSARTVPEGATLADRRARNWWTGPEIFIVVDSWEQVAPRHSDKPALVHELIHWVRLEGYERGIHVIIALNSNEIGVRTLADPVIKEMHDSRTPVVMLSTDKLQGAYGSTKFTDFGIPGRARYVEAAMDRSDRIQIAWSGHPRQNL